MKKLLTALLLLGGTFPAFSQVVVPAYKFETASDYTLNNDAILECCNWMIHTPLEQSAHQIDEVINFLVQWSMGSPDVMILFDSSFMPYVETTPPLMYWHMAGAAKYQLERGIYATTREEIIECTRAGIDAVLDFYAANDKILGRDRNAEKLANIRSKGKLDKFLSKKIKAGLPEEELEKARQSRSADGGDTE